MTTNVALLDPERIKGRVAVVPYEKRFEAEVLARAREMHAESLFHRHIAIDEKKLLQQLEAAHTLPHVYFKIAVRADEVLGGFFGQISSIYFSQERMAKDLAWFVKPSHRGGFAALALLVDFETWARDQGVKHILIGQSTGVRIDETKNLYTRLGYTSLGTNTWKRI